MNRLSFFEDLIQHIFQNNIAVQHYEHVGGGCIHHTVKIISDNGIFFLKWNNEAFLSMFKVESKGLKYLQSKKIFQIPKVISCGSFQNISYLLLEWKESSQKYDSSFWECFGCQMADLHRHTHKKFGLDYDNFIGKLPQSNTKKDQWIDFFINERLIPQVKEAAKNHLLDISKQQKFDLLYQKLEQWIPQESPSLLHGDLWSGNFMNSLNNYPILFDPAIYYGHREIEIAFTRLFGGFDQIFYQKYQEHFPLETGFEDRIDIYHLYPLLVHLNLFGIQYLTEIQMILKRFV